MMKPRAHRGGESGLRALGLALVLCSACGGAPSAPRLTELSLEPASGAHAGEILTVRAHYVDEDGDLGGGRAEVALRRQAEARGQTFSTPLPSAATSSGTLMVKVTLPVGLPPGGYELGLTAIDGSMRRSNGLSTSFELLP